MTRTAPETRDLRRQAQQRARAGESRPDISRAIGVPLHTLARWAFEDRWRRKDLDAEAAAVYAAAIERLMAERRAAQGGQGRGGHGQGGEILEFKSRDAWVPPLPGDPIELPDPDPADPAAPAEPAGPAAFERPFGPDFQFPDPEPRFPAYRSDPPGAVPDWAPGLNPDNEEEEPEHVALWLARDLFMRGKLAEAQRSLRFATSWLAVSRQVWSIEDKRAQRQWSSNNNNSYAWKPSAPARNSGL